MVRSAVVVAPMTDPKAHVSDNSENAEKRHAQPIHVDSDFAPIIRSKIQPPPLRSTTLTRQRLIDRLHETTQTRVTLLVAEAGYGKTTLLADFATRSGQRTLWYRLEPTDADSVTWVNYLVAACREVDPSFGAATMRLLAHGPAGTVPGSAFLETLAAELTSWSAAPTLLVLDDFHRVDRLAEVSEVIYRLIDTAPSWLHFVLSTRRRPPLELARLAAASDLSEINSGDLRFSTAETSRLFAEGYGTPLDAETVTVIDRRTRGWAASLALVHGSIRNKSHEAAYALTQGLSGASTPIYDFLAEEVMGAIPNEIESLIMRASILDFLDVEVVSALFARDPLPPTKADVLRLLEEAEDLGLLSRVSRSSDVREMHPLLRDFLAKRSRERFGDDEIRRLHRDVANALLAREPLVASRHLLNAGDLENAMEALEASILRTIGSGRWGLAAELIGGLRDLQPGPGVAAIRARQLMDDGDLAGAERMLESVDAGSAEPSVRSALRQTQLSLGWRTGRSEMVRAATEALLDDDETLAPIREIAQLFRDTDVTVENQPPLPVLARRLVRMAQEHASSGLDFYSAVALHNASFAFLSMGNFEECLAVAQRSLAAFARIHLQATEALSTHSVMAVALMECGRDSEAQAHVTAATSAGRELADVPALIAVAYLAAGNTDEGMRLVGRSRTLEKQGRGDLAGFEATAIAEAFSLLTQNPSSALAVLAEIPARYQFDAGQSVARRVMVAHAHLAAGDSRSAGELARAGLEESRKSGAHASELRFAVILALVDGDKSSFAAAVRVAASESHLVLPEFADVISQRLDLAELCLVELGASIERYPRRWLPLLRLAIGQGAPAGDHAAFLLDKFGEQRDVSLLRAYSRTYRGRGVSPTLGLALAKRTSLRLVIHDLGRVILKVGDRSVPLSGMRRKAAALLLYLVSRPSFTAHREQALDELWPDSDPSSAVNSLNQSLYFLRREIDPWYEDGVSSDYVGFAGDLLWLDGELVTADSAQFLAAVTSSKDYGFGEVLELLRSYTGHFAPEFEYEEWALALRSKLKSCFLEVAATSISSLIRKGALDDARTVALLALETDETASDVERTLVWLHWKLGAKSAARAQFEHLVMVDRSDGIESVPLVDLVEGPAPLGAQ